MLTGRNPLIRGAGIRTLGVKGNQVRIGVVTPLFAGQVLGPSKTPASVAVA